MRYLSQFLIILGFTLAGEVLHRLVPLPVPASVYGLILLFLALCLGLVKLEQVKQAGAFLISVMPVLFVSPMVGIAERWGVPYLDYGSPQVPLMNRYTGRNVCAKAQEIRERNFCVASDGTTPDNGHPNTAAHEFESTFIEAWLRTL